jgi:hypothetical protein
MLPLALKRDNFNVRNFVIAGIIGTEKYSFNEYSGVSCVL